MTLWPGWFFRRPARPPAGLMAAAALAGLLVAAGQAPLDWWWLALPALAVLGALVAGESAASRRAWLGWAGGAGYFAGAMFWIVEPFLVEPEIFGWMAPFALVLLSGGMALFWGMAAALAGIGRGASGRVIGFGLWLAATDLLRGYILTGFPWALLGHVWIDTPVAQAAAVIGPAGLSIVTVLVAMVPVALSSARGRAAAAAVSLGAVAALWVAGTLRLDRPVPPRPEPVHVRLIQPNAAQHLKWREDMWRVFLDRQFAQTEQPSERPLDLVVWPESAVPFLLHQTGSLFEEMAIASGGVPVAFGIQRQDGLRFFNSLAVIDGAGTVTHVYDKHHLTPFGEYIPFGDAFALFGITALAAQEGNGYTAGAGAAVLDLGGIGTVLPLICYEAIFPQDVRAAPGRADWILQVTNDAWFGNLSGPYQHLAQVRLRAIEQGLPVLRSANTGVSAVIDAKGRVLASLPLNAEGVLDADVPPALPATLYAQWGDWPATIALILGLLGLAATLRRRAD